MILYQRGKRKNIVEKREKAKEIAWSLDDIRVVRRCNKINALVFFSPLGRSTIENLKDSTFRVLFSLVNLASKKMMSFYI